MEQIKKLKKYGSTGQEKQNPMGWFTFTDDGIGVPAQGSKGNTKLCLISLLLISRSRGNLFI